MNHLQEAKRNIGEVARYSGVNTTEIDYIIAHALIAIAEQLERMNNQELRTEKLDFHTITRKVDK